MVYSCRAPRITSGLPTDPPEESHTPVKGIDRGTTCRTRRKNGLPSSWAASEGRLLEDYLLRGPVLGTAGQHHGRLLLSADLFDAKPSRPKIKVVFF